MPSLRTRIDAHHHLWQLGRFPYPWLAPDAPPRPFGDQSELKRDYLVADYRRDMAGLGVIASVFVEANAGACGVCEVEWVDTVATEAIPAVSVGQVDLRRPDVAAMLDRFEETPRMRGIRMSLCWDPRPEWQFIDSPDILSCDAFKSGVRELTRRNLVFDVLVVPGQLGQLAAFAAANPDQQFIINHLGTPLQESRDRAEWTAGMRQCARCPNLAIKLSGLWVIDRKWRPDRIRESVRLAVDLFGTDRCMWASNYPVEKIMCPVREQIANLEALLDDLGEDEMSAVFRDTAARLYRIPVDVSAAPVR